jgi:molybdenum cofactor cytidylyltransferase
MKFASIPTSEAIGSILAHAVSTTDFSFKKGRQLSTADIDVLVSAGITTVVAASFEVGDVPENEAAQKIAEAIGGHDTTLSTAHTGRANLYAASKGLFQINVLAINAINAIDESITIATLAPFESVERRQMLATVKIIPFAAPKWAVDKAIALAKQASPLIDVAAFAAKKVELISTALPGMKQSLLDKNRATLNTRVEALGSSITHETRCIHDQTAVAQALQEACERDNDIILVFGAAATTDRKDVVPAGLVSAGGTIVHFGMPVDPGNLLLLGRFDKKHVIGLPGCARSPKLNGFDFVLQRLCADLAISPSDITGMGVGGLLKEIPTRPQPRDLSTPTAPLTPRIAALVLAAGRSTRMGDTNKLLMPIRGIPMIARTVASAHASTAASLTVVTGHDADVIGKALTNIPAKIVYNPNFTQGMSTSLKVGIAALPQDSDGVLVCLGDMPAVTSAHLSQLIEVFSPEDLRAIIVPTFQGKRGNPVLFARQFFNEMLNASGDTGARAIISANTDLIYEVEMPDAAVLADADTPAAFAALEAEFEK